MFLARYWELGKSGALKSEEEIAAFNEEAAASSGLLAVAKEEAAQLSELKAKTYTISTVGLPESAMSAEGAPSVSPGLRGTSYPGV